LKSNYRKLSRKPDGIMGHGTSKNTPIENFPKTGWDYGTWDMKN